MQECDKGKRHISNKLHMIYVSSNNVRHPVIVGFLLFCDCDVFLLHCAEM